MASLRSEVSTWLRSISSQDTSPDRRLWVLLWSPYIQPAGEEREICNVKMNSHSRATSWRRPVTVAYATLVRQVTWPRLDVWELGALDKGYVQEEELVDTRSFYHNEFNKHSGRLHWRPSTRMRGGQNPPRGRPLVG